MKKAKNFKFSFLYWLVPIFILILQALYFNQALNHIRQEELTESVSNIFWFQKGNICSGLTTSVGWYAQLVPIYNLFGFSLATVKIYKLFLVAISLFCLAAILKNFLGEKKAWFPLLIIGLSPTFIYFSSLSIHYGTDLIYFPICLFLLLSIKFNLSLLDFVKQASLWVIAMIAWMSYPSFVYYLPVLFAVFAYKLYKKQKKNLRFRLKTIALNIAFFLLPLISIFLYVKDKNFLIYDQRNGAGLFRGNGSLNFNLGNLIENLRTIVLDLFFYYSSYYFEIPKVEFSDIYPLISVVLVFSISIYFAIKKKKFKPIIFGLISYLILVLILSSLTGSLGGIRRATAVLACFYALFIFSWYFSFEIKKKNKYIGIFLIGGLTLLFVHHTIAFSKNLEFLNLPSNYREGAWFYQTETPQKSLDAYMVAVQKSDLSLICVDEKQNYVKCSRFGYNLIYPAIAGSCLWNDLNCHEIKKYDFKKKELVPLSLDCWVDEK